MYYGSSDTNRAPDIEKFMNAPISQSPVIISSTHSPTSRRDYDNPIYTASPQPAFGSIREDPYSNGYRADMVVSPNLPNLGESPRLAQIENVFPSPPVTPPGAMRGAARLSIQRGPPGTYMNDYYFQCLSVSSSSSASPTSASRSSSTSTPTSAAPAKIIEGLLAFTSSSTSQATSQTTSKSLSASVVTEQRVVSVTTAGFITVDGKVQTTMYVSYNTVIIYITERIQQTLSPSLQVSTAVDYTNNSNLVIGLICAGGAVGLAIGCALVLRLVYRTKKSPHNPENSSQVIVKKHSTSINTTMTGSQSTKSEKSSLSKPCIIRANMKFSDSSTSDLPTALDRIRQTEAAHLRRPEPLASEVFAVPQFSTDRRMGKRVTALPSPTSTIEYEFFSQPPPSHAIMSPVEKHNPSFRRFDDSPMLENDDFVVDYNSSGSRPAYFT
ncbi:hypothetical protein HK096_006807 [Nowakowskiella sp. JEL0078]|nr:hypothetical protein HK096_006807 [Nowakowskiella sp. JEL0078]